MNMDVKNTDNADWATDAEHNPTATPHSRHRTQRYNATLSPIEASSALKRISQSLHRTLLRIVNFAGNCLDEHILLRDLDGPSDARGHPAADEDDEVGRSLDPFADPSLGKVLRGRTLGLFGSSSHVRHVMYDFLLFSCVCFPSPLGGISLSHNCTGGENLPFFVQSFSTLFC